MKVQFFEDPLRGPLPREEVRFKQLGLFMHDDGRRVAIGFDITPFIERPSIEVSITNSEQEVVGSLNVIEALQTNFSLTMHIREESLPDLFKVRAVLYYMNLNSGERQAVDTIEKTLDSSIPGEQ